MTQYNKPPAKTYKRRGTGSGLAKHNMTKTEVVTRFKEFYQFYSRAFCEPFNVNIEWYNFLKKLYAQGLINLKQMQSYTAPDEDKLR